LPLIAVGLYQLYQIYPDLELGKLKSGFSASMDKIGQIPILPLFRRTSSEKQEGEATEKSGRSFEIGFFLHWGFRKTQHDCELKISLGHRKDDQDSQLENKQA
jgi:hypothetical protein